MGVAICGYCGCPIIFAAGSGGKSSGTENVVDGVLRAIGEAVAPSVHVYHLGTGWYCWRARQGNGRKGTKRRKERSKAKQTSRAQTNARPSQETDKAGIVPFPSGSFSPRGQRNLSKRVIELNSGFLKGGETGPIVRFVRHCLRKRNPGAVRDLLAHVAKAYQHPLAKKHRSRAHRALVKAIVATPEWNRFWKAQAMKVVRKHGEELK